MATHSNLNAVKRSQSRDQLRAAL
ncbi:hypothetical protein V3C99_005859, partial [Haemonchus contortus]